MRIYLFINKEASKFQMLKLKLDMQLFTDSSKKTKTNLDSTSYIYSIRIIEF